MNILEYFKGDDLAAIVCESKYLSDNEKTPDDMHVRMAHEYYRVDRFYQDLELPKLKTTLSKYGKIRQNLTFLDIYNFFKNFKYIIPQGRVMAGLGKYEFKSLSNCLRLPAPLDSYSSIMYVDTLLVNSAKRGMGYGISVSNLRPSNTPTNNAAKTSTGIIPFMERFSNSTREVGQDSRRGACLLDIDIRHPDVLDFIKSKINLTSITGANISVFLRPDFLEAVKNNDDYILRFPCNFEKIELSDIENYNQLNSIKINDEIIYYKKIKALDYWNELIKCATESAEPGVFFRDRMDDYSPSNVYSQYYEEGTNACGEQPMAPYDTCRLMVHNLYSYVKDPFTDHASIDLQKLYEYGYEMQRLLDDLVTLELEHIENIIKKIKFDPEPEEQKEIELQLWLNIKNVTTSGRRTGGGITGLGDMIAALGHVYGSDESLVLVELVMKTLMEAQLDCMIDLAILRGTFSGYNAQFEYDLENDQPVRGLNSFYQFLLDTYPEQVYRMCQWGRRNVNWNTIAPTGSTSILTQTTSGCEPLIMPFYIRRRKINPNDPGLKVDFIDQNGDKWEEYFVIHDKLNVWYQIQTEYDNSIPLNQLSKKEIEFIYEHSPYFMSSANEIPWSSRIKMQSLLQKYTSSAISSTVNLPKGTTTSTVSQIFMNAYELGLKGITIYVDGSRSGVMVSESTKGDVFRKRPKLVNAKVLRFNNNNEKWIAFVGIGDDGMPYEIFTGLASEINLNKNINEGHIIKKKVDKKSIFYFVSGEIEIEISTVFNSEYWNYTKLISGILRHGMTLSNVINTIEGLNLDGSNLHTWKVGIIRALKQFIIKEPITDKLCPECSTNSLEYESGCVICSNCGYSECG